jgi:putative oxidoreductase
MFFQRIKQFLQRNPAIILRVIVAIILLTHSIPVMLNGGVNEFGNLYLNAIGFAPVGLPLAWAIKISHVVAAVLLVLNRYVILAGLVTIFILIMGIILIHFEAGWFVIGNGRNGMEYSVLLIGVLVFLMIDRKTSSPW